MNDPALEHELADEIGAFHDDPLGFVLFAFPWSEPGELADAPGPREWQRETLQIIGERIRSGGTVSEAIQIATASGHGIGKSALVSFIILWAMCTRPDTRGVVTANTEGQLRTKTWAELAKWVRLLICRHWFEFTATAIYALQEGHEKTWRIDAIAWSENNTEAFAGLHNKGNRILVVFDEASAIPPLIWEVTEGALTDEGTEIIWAAFGNPTRNNGRFYECFGRFRHRWVHRQIDARTVEGTNKVQIAKWVEDYGEDSDFVRMRVRGVFPRASSTQFIPRDLVDEAMARTVQPDQFVGKTAAVGVDVARFGSAQSVIRTRVGRDGASIKVKRYRGLDTVQLANKVAEHIGELKFLGLNSVVFVDGGGVGGGVVDNLRRMRFDPIEVNFGSKPDDPRKYSNKRAEMWGGAKDWLKIGILEQDDQLATDLTSVEYAFDNQDRIQLERKEDMEKRGLASPDDGDALALTFAHPVPEWADPLPRPGEDGKTKEYDPYAAMR